MLTDDRVNERIPSSYLSYALKAILEASNDFVKSKITAAFRNWFLGDEEITVFFPGVS